MSVFALVSFAACGEIIFQDDFEQYDIEYASDLSVSDVPTGNWTASDMTDDATRTFTTGNYGGTSLWISNIDGTILTSRGIDIAANTYYEFSAVLLAETSRTGRGVDATYDIIVGSDPGSATSVIGGPVSVIAVGDDEVTPDSKEDQIFTNSFETGIVNPGDRLFIVITRVGTHEGLDAAWFGADDVLLRVLTPIEIVESDGSTSVSEDGLNDSYEIVVNGIPEQGVEITVTPDDQLDIGQGAGISVTVNFLHGQSNIYLVNVQAVDDDFSEGPHTGTISYSVFSGDPLLSSFLLNDTTVTVGDNDPFCGDENTIYLPGDLNMDCYINLLDLAVFAIDWMACTNPADPLCL